MGEKRSGGDGVGTEMSLFLGGRTARCPRYAPVRINLPWNRNHYSDSVDRKRCMNACIRLIRTHTFLQ